MNQDCIKLRGVRVNNLKEIDLDIDHGQWLAVCGVSGSGKSSLAFDTLYAEGQRRYLECLAPGVRKFMTLLDKPESDSIEGLPPAIAVRPAQGKVDRKTTLGGAADIFEYVRLLFSKLAKPYCHSCQTFVDRYSPQSVVSWTEQLEGARRAIIAFSNKEPSDPVKVLADAKANGFARAIIGDRMVSVEEADANISEPRDVPKPLADCYTVVDRVKTRSTDSIRMTESMETAFQFGFGRCFVFLELNGEPIGGQICQIDDRPFERFLFSATAACQRCGKTFEEPIPGIFSFQSRRGACRECDGVGYTDNLYREMCNVCCGSRLAPAALDYRILLNSCEVGQKSLFKVPKSIDISELSSIPIRALSEIIDNLQNSAHESKVVSPLIKEIQNRLSFLIDVGLHYLTLDRPARTLSVGELQRVSLTSCLSSTLVDMLYVLDEPSVGLHVNDVERLVNAIRKLKERGNTVVVVDHEESLIQAAPQILEIGPGAGTSGGEVVFYGGLQELESTKGSPTGDFLAGRRGLSSGAETRRKPRGKLRLTNASGNNLQNLDVEFPLGCLCLVTGVSGAGKSTLVRDTLYPAICGRKNKKEPDPLPYQDLFGDSLIDEAILVDSSPIGRSARSNPVTYVKAFDDIRAAFGETTDAKTRNIKAGQFSFNVAGGRCDKCKGEGQLTIDMQFLSDVTIKCDQCNGMRYREEVLAVRYRDLNIAEVLELTARQAFSFFRGQPKVQSKLKALIDVGLDYIRLGQPATTLSCGEAQRLKLAVYLNAFSSKRVLFILEEPTTGLHMADVVKLVDCFEALLSVGHSFIIVEHNLQLMKYADWIIDIGPLAGEQGGRLMAQGRPEEIAQYPDSKTGQHLADVLKRCRFDDE